MSRTTIPVANVSWYDSTDQAQSVGARQPVLPAKAIWLRNLSPRLVIKRRPGMPVMKVDCQLLTRAFSG